MDSVLKQKWVDALRSGAYKQGNGYLRTKEDKFCCLGVLCDLMADRWITDSDYESCYGYTCGGEICLGYLPSKTKEEISLENFLEEILIQMNDAGESFDNIAKYIQNNL